ncbi:hypothetical protein SAMN06295937_100158 [Sphingopyxis flava]|uniref:Uncharacterized protein n=1 Tax=Sphingopyxis flava TaxID=1507287 RepID=A0A1T4ZRF3_9SPHN|nr:hypothetical protein SAMN06295937_100158 [Sphingopyxis flava]
MTNRPRLAPGPIHLRYQPVLETQRQRIADLPRLDRGRFRSFHGLKPRHRHRGLRAAETPFADRDKFGAAESGEPGIILRLCLRSLDRCAARSDQHRIGVFHRKPGTIDIGAAGCDQRVEQRSDIANIVRGCADAVRDLIADEARRLAVAAVVIVILRRQVDPARLYVFGLDTLGLGSRDQLVHRRGVCLHRRHSGRRSRGDTGADSRLIGTRTDLLADRKAQNRTLLCRCRHRRSSWLRKRGCGGQ